MYIPHLYYKNNRYTRKYKCHVLYQLMIVVLNMFVKNTILTLKERGGGP